MQTVASDGATRSFFTHSANVFGELPRAEVARLLSAGPTSGGGQAVRVAREVEHARELLFCDRERTQGHVKFVGDLLAVSALSAPSRPLTRASATIAPAAHASGRPRRMTPSRDASASICQAAWA